METSSSNSAPNFSPESTKLFVGGINERFKEEEIRDYFTEFGEVKEVVVVKDRVTGNVRGFGFVEFLDPDSAEKALKVKEHAIGELKIDVKRARPRTEQRQNYPSPRCQYSMHSDHENSGLSSNTSNNYYNNGNPTKLKKIFVGGLSSNITKDEFKSYFEKFGKIVDVVIMYDSSTQRPRGFGFITFDSVEAVDCVLEKKFHVLNNKNVEVKIAVPKGSNNQTNFSDSNGNLDNGRGSALNNHQRDYYPSYSLRYGFYPGYATPPVPGFFYGAAGNGGGYGPYGGISYGTPYGRIPWSGQGTMSARNGQEMVSARSPVPYGYTVFNVGFGGYSGMPSVGYHGYVWSGDDKSNPTDNDVRITNHSNGTEDVGSEKLESPQVS
ncbi:uncharacterized protein A4U43_C07F30580 [Asparagus officinalis]|uniref:RRM domain-containing protein n=1 Tax=Asparagus officinalis TaxID=4686 RepID=A0A5P1EG23_ASPOF|nr:heterogeneous nuclear ribonucleoprotein 1-like [Asparagus officinalis]ONK64845.1 uncharacterized protein A4U43_C07F30580 [Asparagus officinalis]